MDSEDADTVSKERRFLQEFLISEENAIIRRELDDALHRHFSMYPVFCPATIKECNAASLYGWLFSEAFCELQDHEYDSRMKCPMSAFFGTASALVAGFLRQKKLPDSNDEITLLYRLIQYLMNTDDQQIIVDFDPQLHGETAYCIVIAEHMLSKLCEKDNEGTYLINKDCQNERTVCPCGCGGPIEQRFGDTSIGNEAVWHGNLDILLQNTPLSALDVRESGEATDSEKEVEPTTFVEVDSNDVTATSVQQLIAQTVVFSFLQRKLHPEYPQFMIPSLGITKRTLLLFLYDSQHDVLFESCDLPLLGASRKRVLVDTILTLWMVVNYQRLSTGLTEWDESEIESIQKANFFEAAEKKLEIYQTGLQFGNIKCLEAGSGRPKRPQLELHPEVFKPKRTRIYDDMFYS